MDEKRDLRRINNAFGTDLKAKVVFEGQDIEAKVLDFNSYGVLLKLNNQIPDLKVSELQILYGNTIICQISEPLVRRLEHVKKELVVSLIPPDKNVPQIPRGERAIFPEVLQGTAVITDPFTIDQALIFKIENISGTGLKLLSSKSNRHLMPGLCLPNVEILLPGYGYLKVDLKIKNVFESTSNISFGCEFLKISIADRRLLNGLALSTNKLAIPTEVSGELRAKIRKVKKFGRKIRIRRVSSEVEFNQILAIRLNAYTAANKVGSNVLVEAMQDSYDQHAIVFAAAVGPNIVGTVRYVFRSEENSEFLPLERNFNLKEIFGAGVNLDKCVEVSKFAVDPHFQGTDLFLAIFKKNTQELLSKNVEYPMCVATEDLGIYYKTNGARQIGGSVPHPTLPGEQLNLYLFDHKKIRSGRVSSIGWFSISKPVLNVLARHGLAKKSLFHVFKYLMLPIDLLKMKLISLWRRKFK